MIVAFKALLSCILLLSGVAVENVEEKPVVTLQKWQYCAGCKATVELFTTIATSRIVQMQEAGRPVGEDLDITNIVNEVCHHQHITQYQPFVRYACEKLMQDHRMDFLETFDGTDASSAFSTVKGNVFHKTKEICLKQTKACPSYIYPNTDVTKKDRTTCKACSIIVDDLEMMIKVIADGRATNEDFVDMLCPTMGYNHQPYNWLEDICDEMVDEFADDMVAIMNLRDRMIQSTGMTPRDSLSEKMCAEFYQCGEEKEL